MEKQISTEVGQSTRKVLAIWTESFGWVNILLSSSVTTVTKLGNVFVT